MNFGSERAIVMGISGKPEQLIDLERAKQDFVPIIKRFSGGGTVIVDRNTLFITFIFAKEHLPTTPFPEPILRWTADLYAKAWEIPGFQLLENDYVIDDKKCGGNAQYIQKERVLHHTSFLWDYDPMNMEYLLLPSKRPHYRQDRSHSNFLTTLKNHLTPKDALDLLKKELSNHFSLQSFHPKSWTPPSYRKTLVCI